MSTGSDQPDRADAIDLAAVARDDELLDALGEGSARLADTTDPVAMLLARWRVDLDVSTRAAQNSPLPTLPHEGAPSPRSIARGRRHGSRSVDPPRRRRARRALATGAVALLAVAAGGGVAAAHPGDLLYPLRKAVAGPAEDSASREVERLLRRAETGGPEAPALLDQAAARLAGVGDEDRRRALTDAVRRQRDHEGAAQPVATPPTPAAGREPTSSAGPPTPRSPGAADATSPAAVPRQPTPGPAGTGRGTARSAGPDERATGATPGTTASREAGPSPSASGPAPSPASSPAMSPTPSPSTPSTTPTTPVAATSAAPAADGASDSPPPDSPPPATVAPAVAAVPHALARSAVTARRPPRGTRAARRGWVPARAAPRGSSATPPARPTAR